jgi:hypothetical protein
MTEQVEQTASLDTMVERKATLDMKAYMKDYNKAYYSMHKERIMKLVFDKKKLVKGSDAYRQKLVEELNSGKRKFIKGPTRARFDLKQDPKTLAWY